MSTSYTASPWRLVSPETGAVYGPHGRMVASVYGDHPECIRDARMDANSHLISAAPELLEAAKAIAAAPHGIALGDLERLEAAIAKAEGK